MYKTGLDVGHFLPFNFISDNYSTCPYSVSPASPVQQNMIVFKCYKHYLWISEVHPYIINEKEQHHFE